MMTHTITDGSLTAVIDGKVYTISNDNPVYWQVRDAILNHAAEWAVADLFRTADAVKRYTREEVIVNDGVLFFNGKEIHNTVVDRIFEFMSKNLPVDPLIKFLNNLLANPSQRAVTELYGFLKHRNLPITEDGCFLAYKGVRDDYMDCHSGTYSNKPGVTNAMKRELVDPDSNRHCSTGFHVGSLEYATSFGPRTVIVKVHPADAVSVPSDANGQKLRVCKYEVVCDYNGPLPRPLYNEPYEAEEVGNVSSW